nr:MAG TPA: hypothetical protein [Caudoviricetes sp.]
MVGYYFLPYSYATWRKKRKISPYWRLTEYAAFV